MNWITAFILTQVIEITVETYFGEIRRFRGNGRFSPSLWHPSSPTPWFGFVFSDIRHDGGFF